MDSRTQPVFTEYYHASTVVLKVKRTFYEAAGKYLYFKLFLIVILMGMSWFMMFEVNETYGYPLNKNRMLNYENKLPNLKNAAPENKHERKELTPAEVLPAGNSQEGDHTENFTLWSHVHEPNTRTRTRTRTSPRTTSRIRTCTPDSTRTKEAKEEEQSCNSSFGENDVVEYNENLKNQEVPHMNYYKNFVFELVLEFEKYLAKAGRSLEPVVSYVVRTCHPVLLLLGTPLGIVTWIYLYFWVKVKQTKREKLKRVSRRKLHMSVCDVMFRKRAWLHVILLYSHMQSAVAMEEALQRLTELTAQNTQQIQALAQTMNNQQAQASTASQQVTELTQSIAQQYRAITEATQATNTALSQQAELTANAFAATGRMTADAVTALSQHAESRRPGEIDLHKMIKAPEVFGPATYKEERDGFLEFRVKMRSWIGALNNDILEKINSVEMDRREESWEWTKLTPAEKEQSRKLHSILASYTRARPLRTLKQVPHENGFDAWRLLVEEHQPHSRARSLQLLNNVLHYRFDNKKSTQENILNEEYEKASGDLVAEDMKISIILAGTEGNMRQHLLLSQKETTKHGTLRQYLLSYEQATRWTTTDLINSGKDHQGQADMGVTRVHDQRREPVLLQRPRKRKRKRKRKRRRKRKRKRPRTRIRQRRGKRLQHQRQRQRLLQLQLRSQRLPLLRKAWTLRSQLQTEAKRHADGNSQERAGRG